MIRFTALNKYTAPPGADYGNYLTQADVLRGYDVTGQGLRYNPLFFVFLNVFRTFLDEFTALKVLASLIFSVIAVPFFMLARKLFSNCLAALVSAWIFLFFEGYSEMIAWGGSPNFLAFSFMLLTLVFLVDSFNESSRRNIFLAGFSLSLVIGTHLLVTVFAFLFFIVFTILTLTFDRKNLGKSIRTLLFVGGVAAVFSLPYLPVYATIVKYSSTDLVELNFLGGNAALLDPRGLLGQYLIWVVIAALGIFALAIRMKDNKNAFLLQCSFFAVPLILSLITKFPSRWFYFLPIPVLLSLALCLEILFKLIRDKKKEIVVLALYFILLISIGSTILSVNRLENAVDYYQTIGDDELQALKWIKEQTPQSSNFATSGSYKDIGGGGNSYSWWVEGYSRRKCIPTGFPAFYSYSDQRSEVNIANRIFSGTYVFEYGNIRATDTFPADMGNPEIAKYVNGQYQDLLFLNDGEVEIALSPVEDEQTVWRVAPFYAETKTTDIYHNETWANATFFYNWPRLKFTRSVTVGTQKSSVDIVFGLVPVNSTLRQFTVNIWGSFYTSLESFTIRNSTVALMQRIPTNDVMETEITISDTNGKLNNTQVFPKDPKYSMPCVTYRFTPISNSLLVRLRISLSSAVTEQNDQRINFYNSYDLVNDLGINYILLNKARIKEYHRFTVDLEHYTIAFQNESIAIFKVARV